MPQFTHLEAGLAGAAEAVGLLQKEQQEAGPELRVRCQAYCPDPGQRGKRMAQCRAPLRWDPPPPPPPPGPVPPGASPSRRGPRGGASGATVRDLSATPRSSGPSGMRSRGPGRHSGSRLSAPGTRRHTRAQAVRAPPPGTTSPSKQWAEGRSRTPGRSGREEWPARWDTPRGAGLPSFGEAALLSPPAGLLGPARPARRRSSPPAPLTSFSGSHPPPPPPARAAGEGMVGGGSAPRVEGCRVRPPDLSSFACSELPFPGGRSSPYPGAGLRLPVRGLVWPSGLLEKLEEGLGSPAPGPCVPMSPARCRTAVGALRAGIRFTGQSLVRLRGCQEAISRAFSFGMLSLKMLCSQLGVKRQTLVLTFRLPKDPPGVTEETYPIPSVQVGTSVSLLSG